jgi:hypothetical protein
VEHADEKAAGHKDDEEDCGEQVVEIDAVHLAFHVALERKYEHHQDEKVDLGAGF